MKVFSPLERPSVTEHIMSQLQEAIKSGALRRGDRLPPEPQLAEELQVSRASLREVLKVLESLGILETRRGAGTFVTERPKQPAADPLLFLFLLQDGSREQFVEFRYYIETSFTRLAQKRLEAHHVEALEKSIAALEAAVEAGRMTAEHDLAFHKIIIEATGNPFMIHVGNAVFELFRESIGRGVREYPRAAVEHHREILAALKSGDVEQVDRAIATSYGFWHELVNGEEVAPAG